MLRVTNKISNTKLNIGDVVDEYVNDVFVRRFPITSENFGKEINTDGKNVEWIVVDKIEYPYAHYFFNERMKHGKI